MSFCSVILIFSNIFEVCMAMVGVSTKYHILSLTIVKNSLVLIYARSEH